MYTFFYTTKITYYNLFYKTRVTGMLDRTRKITGV